VKIKFAPYLLLLDKRHIPVESPICSERSTRLLLVHLIYVGSFFEMENMGKNVLPHL
jgi:hypothetical protein